MATTAAVDLEAVCGSVNLSPGAEPHTLLNFIGGRFVAAAAGGTVACHNPATGKVQVLIARSQPADVDAAVAAAAAALPAWAATAPDARAALLDALADAIEAHAPALAAMESGDSGKTLKMATETDSEITSPKILQNTSSPYSLRLTQHSPSGGKELQARINLCGGASQNFSSAAYTPILPPSGFLRAPSVRTQPPPHLPCPMPSTM